MPRVVPEAQHRLVFVVFIAERAECCGVEIQQPAGLRLLAEPAGRQHAQEMAAGKQKHVAVDLARSANDVIGSGRHKSQRLATGTTVAKQLPVGLLLA